MDVREVHIVMEENGLTEGIVSKTYSQRAIRGELMGQAPPPGTKVQRGSAVDLLVSLGRRPVRFKMPYLDGLTAEDAIFVLERSQLNLGQIRSVQKDDLPKDVVVAQTPLSGYPVASGTMVHLTLNRSKQVTTLDKGLYVFHHRVSNGWLKKHLRLRVSAFGLVYDLYNAFAPPGQELWLLIPRSPGARLFFYQDGDLVWSRSPGRHFEDPVLGPL
jgi:serine/threonine-protein kinase